MSRIRRDLGVVAISNTVNSIKYSTYAVPSTGQLKSRAANTITMDGNLTIKLPAATSGIVRDFILTITVTTAGTLTFVNSDGTSFTEYRYDKNRTSDPLKASLASGKVYQYYFTESDSSGTMRVEMSELISPT